MTSNKSSKPDTNRYIAVNDEFLDTQAASPVVYFKLRF